MGKVSLSDIVNLPAFEEAGSLFHRATGMTISFHDEQGNIVFYPKEERCATGCRCRTSATLGLPTWWFRSWSGKIGSAASTAVSLS